MKKFIETTFTKQNAIKIAVAGVAVVAAVAAMIVLPQADVTENVAETEIDNN